MARNLLSWLLVATLTVSTAAAREIFVDNIAGDDRLNGDRPVATNNADGPVRTIAKALRLCLPGDRIVLAPTAQPYREMVTLQGERQSGYFGKPLVIEGNGAILDGSLPVPDEEWQTVGGDVFRFGPPKKAHAQLFLDAKPLTRIPAPAAGEPLPELKPLEWCLMNGWIYFRTEPGQIPQSYPLSFAALQTGITLYKVHDVVIQNLIVQGFQLDGVNAADGVRDTQLLAVTSRGNGRAGVCVAGGSRLELVGCSLGDNGTAQLLLEGYCVTRVNESLLIPNTAPDIVRHDKGRLYLDGELRERQPESDETLLR